ncbi:MAG: glycosyltransferase family 2 protein [Bacteroidota bacterium]
MKVSIIVPVYNVEKYIQRCLDSIKNQTYRNIECIFVDDCSPDNCFAIIEQQIAAYKGSIDFKILRHIQNKGLSGARNTGTLAATGEYIYYLDSDDEITQDCIEALVKLVKKYPGVEMVQGNTKTIPQPGNDWRNIKYKNFSEFINNSLWIKKHCFTNPRIPVNAWNKLIKKEFLFKNDLFFKEGIIHEDEHWMFFVAKKIQSIAFTEKYCYIHYIIQGSIMQTGNNYKSLYSMLYILNDFSLNVDTSISKTQRKYILFLIKHNMLRINPKTEKKELIRKYHSVILVNIKKAIKSYNIINCIALSIFLLPIQIYSNNVGRKIINTLIKL